MKLLNHSDLKPNKIQIMNLDKMNRNDLLKRNSKESKILGYMMHFEQNLTLKKLNKIINLLEKIHLINNSKDLENFLRYRLFKKNAYKFNNISNFSFSFGNKINIINQYKIYIQHYFWMLKFKFQNILNLENYSNMKALNKFLKLLLFILFIYILYFYSLLNIHLVKNLCNANLKITKTDLQIEYSLSPNMRTKKRFNIFFPFIQNKLIYSYNIFLIDFSNLIFSRTFMNAFLSSISPFLHTLSNSNNRFNLKIGSNHFVV